MLCFLLNPKGNWTGLTFTFLHCQLFQASQTGIQWTYLLDQVPNLALSSSVLYFQCCCFQHYCFLHCLHCCCRCLGSFGYWIVEPKDLVKGLCFLCETADSPHLRNCLLMKQRGCLQTTREPTDRVKEQNSHPKGVFLKHSFNKQFSSMPLISMLSLMFIGFWYKKEFPPT